MLENLFVIIPVLLLIAGCATFYAYRITKRLAEAENQLQVCEQRFHELLESTPDPMVIVGEQGLIKIVNRQAEIFFGYEKEEMLFQPVEMLIPERFREKHVGLRQQFMQNAKNRPMNAGLTLSALTRDGREVLIELSLGFIDNEKKPMVAATLRDISERKRLEAENRRNEIRLFDILNISPIAVHIAIKKTGQIIFYNRSYAELISNFDAIGDTSQTYYANPQDYQDILEELEKGQSVLNQQIEVKLPNRGKTWVLGSYAIIEYQDEDAILGWFYDITERIETQHKLSQQIELQKQTTQELNAIFEAASSGIVRLQNRKIVRCNHKAEEIFGYDAGELEEKDTRIWHPNDESYQHIGELSQQVIIEGGTYQDELQYVKKDGSSFWCSVKAQLLDVEDKSKGIVVVLNDVTDKHQATQALLEAKEIAESATKMKSDFLANMSHEIRTPMNAIIGLSHLVMKTEMTDKQREYLRKIQLSSQHLLGVINDILDFSKIESGKLTIENIEFDLENMLTNISQLIHDKAIEKGLELIFDIAPDVPNNLIGDPLRIGQTLINLGTNAIKFTQQGEINVVIRKLEETDETVLIRFAVIDTGIGLSDEQIPKLFKSFQQADTSTTRKYGGTGLGLAICKNLVEMMGGQVGLNSKLGKGAEFWFTVPLGKGTHPALSHCPDLRGKRALVVDNNENARIAVTHLLLSMSFEIDEVDSGKAALEAVQKALHKNTPYDAIFLDWQMPNMDGIAVAKHLQNMGLSSTLKMFLITAYGREEVLNHARTVGFDEVLLKPVTASILFDSMARAFGQTLNQEFTVNNYVSVQDLSSIVGAQILVVEDNQINQEIAQELLESEGFEVDIAENGQIALEKVQQKNYDLVLMDMQMPIMDGVSATIEMRKLAQFNALPIIAMTANAMAHDKARCLEVGMNDHIAKPIEPEDLWAKLLKWIKPLHSSTLKTSYQITNQHIAISTGIEGLDSELGLQRVLNKREFYVSILKSFASTQANTLSQIEIALQKNDFDSAYRLAHTLKGLLGNIGATTLQVQLTEIEASIKNHDALENITPKLKTVEPILSVLIMQLQDYLQLHNSETVPPQILDVEALKTVLAKLAVLFASSDSDAVDYFAEHSGLLKAAFSEQFKLLQTKIDNYDFPDALELLKQAALTQQIEI